MDKNETSNIGFKSLFIKIVLFIMVIASITMDYPLLYNILAFIGLVLHDELCRIRVAVEKRIQIDVHVNDKNK